MSDTTWTTETEQAAEAYFRGFQSLEDLREAWRSWEELTAAVEGFLSEKALRTLDGKEVYSRVVALFEGRPRLRGRFKALVNFQEGERLKEALIRLIGTRERGDPGRRIEAMKLGGIGRATASELLCLWWPYRFLPQNAASGGALAKLVPFYKKRDILELPYAEFMDLASTLENAYRERAEALWPAVAGDLKDRRYLYFYCFLTDLGSARRPR